MAFRMRQLFLTCRQASAALADSHVYALHKLLLTVANSWGFWSHRHGAGSPVLRQLTQLMGHLLMAVPLDRQQQLCHSLLDVSIQMTGVTVVEQKLCLQLHALDVLSNS